MIDAKELVFNAVRSPNVQANPLLDHGPAQGPSTNMITVCTSREDEGEQGWPSPFVIEYVPTEAAVSVIGITRSGLLYENPATTDKGKAPATEVEAMPRAPSTPPKKVTEEEAEAFKKIIKASEYKVVEKMAKSPAHISLLALLLNLEPHREALLRVLTAAQCNNHIVGRVMIDNGSALNVCPVTTLKQMNVDLNCVRPSKTAVRAFDGSRREVNGEIDLLIYIGPCSFSVTFQVLDIPNAFSLLLGRPWIHSAGAIPSSLHQKLKFIVEERIIMVKGEEDYAIYKETAVPYISVGNDGNLPFHSFETISVIRDYGEVGLSRVDRMIGKVLLRHNYIPGTGLGARGQGISRPIEVEELHSNPNLRHVDSNPPEECLGELGPIYFGEGLDEDSLVPEMEESLRRLEDHQLTSLKPTGPNDRFPDQVSRGFRLVLRRHAEFGPVDRFVVSERGIEVDPDKVKAIKELPPPSSVREVRGFLGRLNYIARFIANLTDKCQPLFRLLRKNAAIEWDEECQKAFDTIKAYLVRPPVLVPPTPGHPLVLYLTVRRQSLGCMLGQEEESTHTERAIYYLSKKFTDGESNYPEIEKMCCALVWVMQRLRQYKLYHTIRLLSKTDPLKYLLDSPSSMRNLAKWRCQLTEYDIEYMSRTSVKGQAIADHLAEFPIEDSTPIDPNFPDEGILQVDDEGEKPGWKMYFDGAVNSTGSGIGAVLISPDERYYPVAAKIDFPCTNNVAEYESCARPARFDTVNSMK
ncbi:hypothetical protein CRG98_008426 [Punica granatum]|uniref:G-patch domain-containing protein n=1 Tax=Punica granatum TaxID=22663 RepID=A0A2I0KRS9_PUNGR|nr:hypothetical protein CRG98_008426 [Punica granatum]